MYDAWIHDNWVSFVQSAGIVGGLCFNAISIRQATQARKVSDLLTLNEQHQNHWQEMYANPNLSRVLAKEVDFIEKPLTLAEERYLNESIVRFTTGWQVARSGALFTVNDMRLDAGTFFQLPLPKKVWEESKKSRNPK